MPALFADIKKIGADGSETNVVFKKPYILRFHGARPALYCIYNILHGDTDCQAIFG